MKRKFRCIIEKCVYWVWSKNLVYTNIAKKGEIIEFDDKEKYFYHGATDKVDRDYVPYGFEELKERKQ